MWFYLGRWVWVLGGVLIVRRVAPSSVCVLVCVLYCCMCFTVVFCGGVDIG